MRACVCVHACASSMFCFFNVHLAGTGTTSQTLRFALMYMAFYPDIQRKVQDEIDAVIGKFRPMFVCMPHVYC